jgi:hypothetical protein
MKVWQIAFDSQKHKKKYALQAQNDIGLSEIGTFYIGLLDINIKEYIRNGLVF